MQSVMAEGVSFNMNHPDQIVRSDFNATKVHARSNHIHQLPIQRSRLEVSPTEPVSTLDHQITI
jgi:hypothetical protein